jgi:hypothetical protein
MTISVAEAKSVASREEQRADGALPENSTPDEGSLGNYVVTSEDIDDAQEEDLSLRDPKSLTAFERKILHWQTSPFAVGRVNASWKDDQYNWFRPGRNGQYDRNSKVCCSAHVCGFIGAKRVGNLAVLAQTTEEYDHIEIINEETGEHRKSRRKRPKLLWVLGPYWHFNFFLTYPLIIGISLLTGLRNLADSSLAVIVSWSVCTFLMIFSLIMAGCRDPGVLYRHPHPPPNTQGWTWNDQAKTYRPPSARFDPECQAVIEGFDHT